MKTRVSPIFLNIMMRAVGELNRAHPDTNAILAGMRETTDILVLEVGGDFELVWSKGNVYPLPFECSQTPTGSCCGIRVATNSSMRGVHPETLIHRRSINRLQSCM
jgi:hypothetical protein